MKKNVIAILAATTLTLGLTACASGNANSNNVGENTAFALTETKDIYAYSAVSAATVISEMTASTFSAVNTQPNATDIPTADYSSYVETVNRYMSIAENMLSGENFAIAEVDSDRADYEYKMVISYSDLFGEKTEYVMYYNKLAERDDDDDFDLDDVFEGEEEFNINGIVLIGETEYAVIGESESEGDEQELELTVKMDSQNFVTVNQETENGEIEYIYTVWQNGRRIEETSFESETERNKHELEIGVLKDGKRQYFTFEEREVGGRRYIQGRVKDDTNSFAFEIDVKQNVNTGEYEYEYKFNDKVYEKRR